MTPIGLDLQQSCCDIQGLLVWVVKFAVILRYEVWAKRQGNRVGYRQV